MGKQKKSVKSKEVFVIKLVDKDGLTVCYKLCNEGDFELETNKGEIISGFIDSSSSSGNDKIQALVYKRLEKFNGVFYTKSGNKRVDRFLIKPSRECIPIDDCTRLTTPKSLAKYFLYLELEKSKDILLNSDGKILVYSDNNSENMSIVPLKDLFNHEVCGLTSYDVLEVIREIFDLSEDTMNNIKSADNNGKLVRVEAKYQGRLFRLDIISIHNRYAVLDSDRNKINVVIRSFKLKTIKNRGDI